MRKYRITQDGFGIYRIQQKGWVFWHQLGEMRGFWGGSDFVPYQFHTLSEAEQKLSEICAWEKKQQTLTLLASQPHRVVHEHICRT